MSKFLEMLKGDSTQVSIIVGTAVAVLILLAINYGTRTGIIARATLKEIVRQPVFLLLGLIGSAIIMINVVVPFFAFEDDTRMFIECGIATAQITALIMAVWTASTSVAEEIEGKTAMTLLSKPVNRQQFILGKYFGILQAGWLILFIIGVVFFCCTYFKFGYDSGEHGQLPPPMFTYPLEGSMKWLPYLVPQRLEVAMSILPGLTLVAFEVAIMAAISVAISTRFPMLVNILACLSVFVLGHLTPLLAISAVHPIVAFVAKLFATICPVLEHFNIQGNMDAVRPEYLANALLYCCAYSVLMLMAALISFEDRDLA
ncbi:MAG: ABC transporter permease subunit [Planctomycetaceae bacterium]|nr:ABC transporter permease subunit [Planctomycetaceae bacterium]MCA9045484.1 ABC transporter permease subunit [Planctomycetaceae bacterium]MCB9952268.1 ABC transporter permease subunit [Planctomycetaceae bacterium]